MQELRPLVRLSGWLILALGLYTSAIAEQPILTPIDSIRGTPFTHTGSMVLSSDGHHLYAVSRFSDLAAFRRESTEDRFELFASYLDGEDGHSSSGAGAVTLSRDDRHLYVLTSEPSGLAAFDRDPTTGALSPLQTLVAGEAEIPPEWSPGKIEESPSGDTVYVAFANGGRQGILVYGRNASGRLAHVQTMIGPVPPSHRSYSLSDLLVSADGKNVYTFGHPVVSVFDVIDTESGVIAWVGHSEYLTDDLMGMTSASNAVASPDGLGIYVHGHNACYNSCSLDGVAMLRRDPATGSLDFLGHASGSVLDTSSTVYMSPDGRHVYVTDSSESVARISRYERHPSSGVLERRGEIRDENVLGYSYIQARSRAGWARTVPQRFRGQTAGTSRPRPRRRRQSLCHR